MPGMIGIVLATRSRKRLLVVGVENEVEPEELDHHAAGLTRESQGLSCLRFLSVRYGHPFRIAIDRERGVCLAELRLECRGLEEPNHHEDEEGAEGSGAGRVDRHPR